MVLEVLDDGAVAVRVTVPSSKASSREQLAINRLTQPIA